jgi:PPP family 3-phenylpropionic acid transporter
MRGTSRSAFRIEAIFAGAYSSYWMGIGAFSGFMAVYLSFYGYSNTEIGLTASFISLITITLQLFFASFSDANAHFPIKRILTFVYFILLGIIAVLALLPLPLVLLLLVYSIGGGLYGSLPGLINAQLIQFINRGVPVSLGWPRGVSSITYALAAFFIGRMLESYSVSILMPICLVITTLAALMAMLTPVPGQGSDDGAIPSLAQPIAKTTLRQLLSSNRVLRFFLLSGLFMYAGQSNVSLFLTRLIEANGGNKADLGLAMFIQAGVEMPAMFLTPWLLRKFRARAILSFSVLAYAVKFTIIYFSGSLAGVYSAMAFSVFCFGLYGATSMFFVNDIVKYNEKVRAQTLVTATGAFSAFINNLTSGWIVDQFGIGRLNLICMLLQFVAVALMGVCAWMQLQSEKYPSGRTGLP